MDWFEYTFLALHLCLSGRPKSGGQVIVDSTLEAALDQKLQAMRDQDRSVDFLALMSWGVFFSILEVSIEMIFKEKPRRSRSFQGIHL